MVVLTCFAICGCVYVWVCNAWVCVCVGFVMCGCFDNCVGLLVICVLAFTVFYIVCAVFLYFSFMHIYSYLLLV